MELQNTAIPKNFCAYTSKINSLTTSPSPITVVPRNRTSRARRPHHSSRHQARSARRSRGQGAAAPAQNAAHTVRAGGAGRKGHQGRQVPGVLGLDAEEFEERVRRGDQVSSPEPKFNCGRAAGNLPRSVCWCSRRCRGFFANVILPSRQSRNKPSTPRQAQEEQVCHPLIPPKAKYIPLHLIPSHHILHA